MENAENETPKLEESEQEVTLESNELQEIREKLNTIVIQPPKIESQPDVNSLAEYPLTYKENEPKEKLVLQFAENFRRQFVHLYRDRKPLLLSPTNECGLEKFVCTTIRPTLLPYKELYNWDGCAEFVADYITFKPLDPPVDLPKSLMSPSTVLKQQRGNCFNISTLLCSLLLGAGYDAYVVSGYSSKETCLSDETREVCPLLNKKEEVLVTEKKKLVKKYAVKPVKDLRSKYIRNQDNRKAEEEKLEVEKRKKENQEKLQELEKPEPDDLHGLRVHSWVLILAGKREVPENFFVDPLTGHAHPTTSPSYLGIESLWNNTNYWVNMQDCSDGCKSLMFDLGDCTRWEFMLPTNEKPLLEIPEMGGEDDLELEDDEDENEEDKVLDLPPSWVEPLRLSLRDYHTRCPQGKKTLLYKKAKVEKFAHYLLRDGLVTRLSVYGDDELKDLVQVKEWYEFRADKLDLRIHNVRTGLITEYYKQGRNRHLKEHVYKMASPGPESERTMIFYSSARVDGLCRREEVPTEMTENFEGRDDHLYYRHIIFGKRQKKLEPQSISASANPRPILKIMEKFCQNPAKRANEDVAERLFLISEDKIQLTFHREDKCISASTREFIKPPNASDKGSILQLNPDMTSTFQVDRDSKNPKNLYIYNMMVGLLEAEEATIESVRESEEEVRELLNDRMEEESVSELTLSVYDTERNEKAKEHRRELERMQMEEKLRGEEQQLDYLAPFLAQIGDPTTLTSDQANQLREDCLSDLKLRLIDKANLIQARFEKETGELQKKQQEYQQHQVSMTKEDEEQYLNYCSEAMFRIHILELRLNRHKEVAPEKYRALELKLKEDKRLSHLLTIRK